MAAMARGTAGQLGLNRSPGLSVTLQLSLASSAMAIALSCRWGDDGTEAQFVVRQYGFA